ncbi:MAG: HupE/UreJ family protein [Burkholderiales bacterium]|nr:HupE/UreJ family protein [Burkholderiales bacterium]
MKLLAALLLWLPALAFAHKPSDSYLTLRADGERIAIRWDIALRDLDFVLQLDRDGNGELTWGEVRGRSDDIRKYAIEHLSAKSGTTPCVARPTGPLLLDRHSDGTYAVLSLVAECEKLAPPFKLRYTLFFDTDPTHRGLVQWSAPEAASPQALVFAVGSAEQELQLKSPSAWETLRQYVLEGVWHIWIGFDHILFLLSLLLPAVVVRIDQRWEPVATLKAAVIDVVKVVTAFTVAHSITLSLAVLGVVSLPSRLVESVIAASVVFAALNNLWGVIDRRRWAMAFVFGLIHGFGFASVLRDLGLPQDALALALVGFNVGVELGQLAIVLAFVPVAFWLRTTRFYRKGVLAGGSVLIALLALWWFIERAFDLG